MKKLLILSIMLMLVCTSTVQAEVKLNAIFMDHMVLQRDLPVKVYGTANPDEQVMVRFAGQHKQAIVSREGRWMVTLMPIPANAQGRTLEVIGTDNTIELNDVLVGDVWLCTGQSNMAGTVGAYVKYGGGMFEEFKNVPGDYHNEQIRLFTVGTIAVDEPLLDMTVEQEWDVCDPETALAFSCTGYFFGKYLQPEIGVPLGLIKCAYGGTGIVSWLPQEAMEENEVAQEIYLDPYQKALEVYPQAKQNYERKLTQWSETKKDRKPQEPMGPNHIKRPAAMYNGMVHPLHRFAVKGAIWYQGEYEGNRGVAEGYKATFPLMISTWRERWGQGDFPFIFVQLAAHKKVADTPVYTDWARLREAQLYTLKTVPHTGMAVAIDAGLTTNIHPPYKALVGERLAKQALTIAYGKGSVSQGPLYESMEIRGREIVLSFKHVGSGLVAKDMVLDAYGKTPYELSVDKLEGFTVAGADQVFYVAEARIESNQVVVRSPQVAKPVAVRYAWANFPLCNLFNKEGFAAAPFRTDDWPMKNN